MCHTGFHGKPYVKCERELFIQILDLIKKSFKIPKGQSESVNSKKNRQYNGQKIPKGQTESIYQRRTDNTMAKRKRTKRQTMIYNTYT